MPSGSGGWPVTSDLPLHQFSAASVGGARL